MARGRLWTQADTDYIEDYWGIKPIRAMARHLNRTEISVRTKAWRIGLGGVYSSGEHLSANQVARLLGIDTHAVTDYWIPKCGLKANSLPLTKRTYKAWRISIKNLAEWLKANQDKWDSRKLELYGLGEEYPWLREKRKADMQAPTKRFQKWTKEQDSVLISLYRHGLTQKEIGKRIGRSEDGVQRRISRLKERGALPMCKITLRWTEQEEAIFRELDARGLTDTEIAAELGREREHIVDHRRCLRARGVYQGRKGVVSLGQIRS